MEILVVDDSRTMRMIVQRTIRQAGFNGVSFLEAEDGAAGLEKLRTHTPDLVLSDWNMPTMSGIDFLVQLRSTGNTVPFGFITSEGSEEIRERAIDAGVNFLIAKPFTPEDVRAALTSFVEGK